ncbi:MAG: conjugal transfer protein TraN, partial [Flavobacteriales bacterium]|nr:conjugal transfer protein TraN [Flavobacteriales bacterium]
KINDWFMDLTKKKKGEGTDAEYGNYAEQDGEDQSSVKVTCTEGDDRLITRVCHRYRYVNLQVTPARSWTTRGCIGHTTSDWKGRESFDYCPGCRTNYHHIPKKVEVIDEGWTDDCSALHLQQDKGQCSLVSGEKLEANAIKTIEGESVTREHWGEKFTYNCALPTSNTCKPLRDKNCEQIDSECVEHNNDRCIKWRQTFICHGKKKLGKKYVAKPDSIHCLMGDCFDKTYAPNTGMMKALSQMTILKHVQDDLRTAGVIFRGGDLTCSRNWVSWKDCCSVGESGWGQSLNLASCSGEEKKLAEQRARGVCVLVGTYVSKKVAGVTITKKTSFCCFGTKLAKLVQEQGRAQLGIGWGEPESPSCRGLTPQELSRLDFAKMNLSELFADVASRFKPDDLAAKEEQIKDRVAGMVTTKDEASKQAKAQYQKAIASNNSAVSQKARKLLKKKKTKEVAS